MIGWVDRAIRCAGSGKIVKSAPFALLPLLAGCVHTPTLEELEEQCMKRGGMLMIIYTQELTLSGEGEQMASPGRCVLPESFDKPSDKPLQPPPTDPQGN